MTDRGFVNGKPFYVASRMWLGKTWYMHNNRYVYIQDREKTDGHYGYNKWFYDHKTKTIRNAEKDFKDKWALTA